MPFVKYDRLPSGVTPLKHYRSLNVTLVECAHDREHVTHLVDGATGMAISTTFCQVCRSILPTWGPVKMLALLPPAQEPLF